ncbi:putative quinol monooxygenase [Tsuneonella sp. HG222]
MKGMLIYFDIKPGMQDAFEAATRKHISDIRERDPSYSLYSLARLRESDTRYVLVQRFGSWENQMAHRSYDYVLENMKAMEPCIAAPPLIEELEIID